MQLNGKLGLDGWQWVLIIEGAMPVCVFWRSAVSDHVLMPCS